MLRSKGANINNRIPTNSSALFSIAYLTINSSKTFIIFKDTKRSFEGRISPGSDKVLIKRVAVCPLVLMSVCISFPTSINGAFCGTYIE